ncbi:MAG: hypothetical protein CUN49_08440 [Candidatus Thermofonsia Clade 1 bacterium]|jgi:hypothetical protein|uniref:Glycoside hydrolase family 5 domain-containing protein n=1 Tax=Candidatus Thermofonsia Clade 1 bacterium TaxID=2364210 RepID=A0A2M8PE71_9CHLR|nr:MAG: hypothetical protein CUN49_08440 [Candidatus Thermofonsia Clade 1 bacterium]RMF50773.1 MAG: hypothetical protein D6749_09690 [Chloroflexota bacterium]
MIASRIRLIFKRAVALCLLLALIGVLTSSTAQAELCLGALFSTWAASELPEPTTYMRAETDSAIGTAQGIYTGEISSGRAQRKAVDRACLPNRPFLGTELYWLPEGESGEQERAWLRELQLDFLRVEVTADEVRDAHAADPFDPSFSQADFDYQSGRGWHFNDPERTLTNIMPYIGGTDGLVRFPLMMVMHHGGESYMGNPPNSQAYADYFLAVVYYYNVVLNQGIKYWEVLNEPDWGYGEAAVSPSVYAAIFRRVAERIRAHPDPRVNSIRLGGPVLGSGDPIDGDYPTGFANRTNNGERAWRAYIPTLLAQGSRRGAHDVGFLSWHDYGSDTWDVPNNLYRLENIYALYNRVNALYAYSAAYPVPLPLVISEMNLAAGKTLAQSKAYYKNFYAALWHTSALNTYFATGKVRMLSHFFWKGNNHWPKGLVYQDADSGNALVRNPVWWAYREYIAHTAQKILAAYTGLQDRWLDAIVTTDADGQVIYLIAVNKSDAPRAIDFAFDAPEGFGGTVLVSKRTMQPGGDGLYGAPFAEPLITDAYQWQPVQLALDRQIRYAETLPPRTIVYYTLQQR